MTKSSKADAGADQVQKQVDKEVDQGFGGVAPDPTPNENYTVSGVTKGKPTPETDPKLAAEAHTAFVRGSDDSNPKAGTK